MNNRPDQHDSDDHHRGLTFDLATLISRRRMMSLFAGAGAVALVGCGSKAGLTAAASTTTGSTIAPTPTTTAGTLAPTTTVPTTVGPKIVASACSTIPRETAGPFPGDGTNGPNALTLSGIVRRDIRSSLGTSKTVAQGVPLTVNLGIFASANSCKALAGAAVYLWHCDRDGNYSMYSSTVAQENYLRGVQAADSAGIVSFTTIFPGCYDGRWPHIHFEVFASLDQAAAGGKRLGTSQLALPEDACKAAYTGAGYQNSVTNLARTSLSRDNVFGDDGARYQLPAMSGNATSGYVADLAVVI